MKFSDFKRNPPADPTPHIQVRVPPPPGSPEGRQQVIDLAEGRCPDCGHAVLVDIDKGRKKIFYTCADNWTHFFVLDAME